jgi:eukaryotic-like serine/threonine-protein kinase
MVWPNGYPQHARKVLGAFGTAYAKLPERERDRTKDQHAFLDQAITELSQDGKVIPVRLALFAEMMKGKPWTPDTLRKVGGTEGVGITFLEETFSSPQANPKHRHHQKAAQAVLKALLPETGTDIRGQLKSEQELQEAASSAERSCNYAELMHNLDNELRLITPTEPDEFDVNSQRVYGSGRYYQLTHDYLVSSLRDWLSQKQRQTRKGRAEMLFRERYEMWKHREASQHLPTIIEWAQIMIFADKSQWTSHERRMFAVKLPVVLFNLLIAIAGGAIFFSLYFTIPRLLFKPPANWVYDTGIDWTPYIPVLVVVTPVLSLTIYCLYIAYSKPSTRN